MRGFASPPIPFDVPESPAPTPSLPGIEIAPNVRVPEHVLRFSFSSSSGPGGQNVNKRATKCTLRIFVQNLPLSAGARHRLATFGAHYLTDDGEVIIQADDNRSQERNRAECLAKLREVIIAASRVPKVRKATKPSKGAKRRRLEDKKQRGETKARRRPDFD